MFSALRHSAIFLLIGWLAFVSSAAAHPGVGIVMDRRGNVFYTDLAQVWRIDPQGRKSVAVRSVHTHELALDAAGNLYGEHLWYEGDATKQWGYRVWRLSPAGALTDVIPKQRGFLHDFSFVRDGAGNMYWAEGGAQRSQTLIRKRAPDGAISTLASCPGCRDVRWMTAAADGTVLFIDAGDLVEVSPAGALRTVAKDLQDRAFTQPQVNQPHLLMGLWTDAARNTYVAVYGARVVKKISPRGQVQIAVRSPFPWSPTGGFIAPNGDLWLLECSYTNAVRVRRIGKDGRATVF